MSEWPADEISIERARAALSRLAPTAKVVVASDHDVDALAGAAVFVRALRRQMIDPQWLVARRGESALGLRARIEEGGPDLAIVVGLGSGPVPAKVPTIVIEHRPCPPVGILVDAAGHAPVVTSSWLAWHVAAPFLDVEATAWLAVLGVLADLGSQAAIPGFSQRFVRFGRQVCREAVSLLNVARRAPNWLGDVAAGALDAARSPADIARGLVPGGWELFEARREVSAELSRCGRIPPRIRGRWALLLFTSSAHVQSLVALRWARRLRDKIVIAANEGLEQGRVSFAVRTMLDVDVMQLLEDHAPDDSTAEYRTGRAAGGNLRRRAFFELLARLGFEVEHIDAWNGLDSHS